MAALPAGGFVVVWMSSGQDGDFDGIYGQRYNSTGQPEGLEFQVNTYTTSFQWYPAVAALPAGGFVVVWESFGQDGAFNGIYGQRFNTTGQPEGSEFQANHFTLSDQSRPVVSAFNSDNFVVVWDGMGNSDAVGIYARISGTSLVNNQLMIKESTTVLMTPNALSASSLERPDNPILFTLNKVQHGRFENRTRPGVNGIHLVKKAIHLPNDWICLLFNHILSR